MSTLCVSVKKVLHSAIRVFYIVDYDRYETVPWPYLNLPYVRTSHLATGNHRLHVASAFLRINQTATTRLAQVVLPSEVKQLRVNGGRVNIEHEFLWWGKADLGMTAILLDLAPGTCNTITDCGMYASKISCHFLLIHFAEGGFDAEHPTPCVYPMDSY